MLSRTPRPSHRSLSSRTRAPPLSNAPHYRSLDTAHPRPRLQSLSSRTRDPASVCLLSRTSRPRHCPTRPVTVCLIPRIRATATPPLFAFFAHPRPRHHSLSSRTAPPPTFVFFAHSRPRHCSTCPHYRLLAIAHPYPRLQSLSSQTHATGSVCFLRARSNASFEIKPKRIVRARNIKRNYSY